MRTNESYTGSDIIDVVNAMRMKDDELKRSNRQASRVLTVVSEPETVKYGQVGSRPIETNQLTRC